jgi:hypothetical protein
MTKFRTGMEEDSLMGRDEKEGKAEGYGKSDFDAAVLLCRQAWISSEE